MRKARPSFRVVLIALVTLLMRIEHVTAQDRAKIEIAPILGHSEHVTSVAFSRDGARVLSGSSDNTIKLWDAATGALIRTFEGHVSGSVESVAFSRDGARVLSGSSDNTIKLWDAATGALIRTFEGHSGAVSSVAFSADGARVLSGSGSTIGGDNTIKLWDAATGALIRTFEGHSDSVWSVAFSADGARLLSGSEDSTIKLWDAATGALIRTFQGDSNSVYDSVRSVAFSPDGARVVSSSFKTIKLWDGATGALIRIFEGHDGWVYSVAFSADSTHVLSGSDDQTIKLWDAATAALIRTFEGHDGWVNSVAFSADGARVLSGSSDKVIKLWDAATGELIRTFEGHASGSTNSVAFSADGARVLSGSSDNTIKLWDAATGALIRTFEGHSGAVSSVAFSADGSRVLSGSSDNTIKMWDPATGVLIRTFEGHADSITSVVFSPDGARVLSGSWDRTIKLWDAATGTLIRIFRPSEMSSSWVTSVAFSPDGTRVSGSYGDTIKLWDAATGALIRTFQGDPDVLIVSVAFSRDGARVSGSYGDTITLWDAATGVLIRTFQEDPDVSVQSVAFSADGARVLSGGNDKKIKLWDAATGALIRTFEGHSGRVESVAFSADGARVLSGSDNSTIRIWNLETGQLLATLLAARDGEWLAMTPAGFFAASRKGAEMLGVVRGLEFTSVDQIHQSLFNPDLLRETLAGDLAGEVKEAAAVMNLEKVLDSGPAPVVAITSHPSRSQSDADLVTLNVRIADKGKGIGRIEWRVNGVTTAVSTKKQRGGPDYNASQQLALDPGENTIEVIAYNGSNLLASLPARTTIKFTGPADRKRPKLHILAIGVNAYVDRGSPLRFGRLGLAVKDATTFSASVKKAAEGLYDEVRVTLALDKSATRENLEKIIGSISREVHPRDSFFLFAAGHGTSENGRFYFIPQDYQSGPGNLARHAIGQDRLQDWLANRIKAKRAIVLLDTCESGALVAGHVRSRADAAASDAAVGRLHEATGRPVLTAAAAGQFAHEGLIAVSGERHGVFTWALLDALRKGDTNGNGLIELSELVRHVQGVVPKIAAQLGGAGRAASSEPVFGKQAARFGSRGEDFALVRQLR